MEEQSLTPDIERCFDSFNASIASIQGAYKKLVREINDYHDAETVPNDFLKEMAGNLAHEIRNPLGGIANFVALLRDDGGEQQPTTFDNIQQGIERIDKVVENLIVFSNPVVPNLMRCNFKDLVRGAIECVKRDLRIDTRSRFLTKLPRGRIILEIDPELMLQALKNVLQNAVEAMPDGGRVELSVKPLKTPNEVVITVVDEGRGLQNGDEEKAFYPFYTTKTNGMGLGLPTARLIIAKHGGKIKLKNRAKKGVEASIRLPLPNA
jgi:signal transduction histidine kinase